MIPKLLLLLYSNLTTAPPQGDIAVRHSCSQIQVIEIYSHLHTIAYVAIPILLQIGIEAR